MIVLYDVVMSRGSSQWVKKEYAEILIPSNVIVLD